MNPVPHVCIAGDVSSACNSKSLVQHKSTCQPAMHGYVSAQKPYFIIEFGFRMDKLPIGADAVQQSAVEVKVIRSRIG